MKKFPLSQFKRGWLIGDFEPSILRTDQFEVAVLFHPKGEVWPEHFHSQCIEYNVLISGAMLLGDIKIVAGTVFIFEPGEVSSPVFLEDCTVVCIKVPSIPTDKHLI